MILLYIKTKIKKNDQITLSSFDNSNDDTWKINTVKHQYTKQKSCNFKNKQPKTTLAESQHTWKSSIKKIKNKQKSSPEKFYGDVYWGKQYKALNNTYNTNLLGTHSSLENLFWAEHYRMHGNKALSDFYYNEFYSRVWH